MGAELSRCVWGAFSALLPGPWAAKKKKKKGLRLTSQLDEVIVLQLVDGFEFPPDVEVLGGVEEVPDSRVFRVTAEDFLGFQLPGVERGSAAATLLPASLPPSRWRDIQLWTGVRGGLLVRLVDIVDGEDGQVPVVAEIAQGHPHARLERELVDGLLRHVQSNGHAEEHAIGEAVVLDDPGRGISVLAARTPAALDSGHGWIRGAFFYPL